MSSWTNLCRNPIRRIRALLRLGIKGLRKDIRRRMTPLNPHRSLRRRLVRAPRRTRALLRLGRWMVCRRLRRMSRTKRWILGISTAFAVLSVASALILAAYWPVIRRHKSEKMTDRAYAAWQQSDPRTADLMFRTAIDIDPTNLRPVVLLARMHMDIKSPMEGRTTFMRALNSTTGRSRVAVINNYHDAALAAGAWAPLAEISLIQLGEVGRPDLIWLIPAIEGIRLSKALSDDMYSGTRSRAMPDPVARAIIKSQYELNANRPNRAEAALNTLPLRLDPALAVVVARQWLRIGMPARAQRILMTTGQKLTEIDLLMIPLVLAAEDMDGALAALRTLRRYPGFTAKGSALPETAIAFLLANPDPRMAAEFRAGLEPRINDLPLSTLSALWLHASLAGAPQETALWADALNARTGKRPAPLAAGTHRLTENEAVAAINTLPLNRAVIAGILSATVR